MKFSKRVWMRRIVGAKSYMILYDSWMHRTLRRISSMGGTGRFNELREDEGNAIEIERLLIMGLVCKPPSTEICIMCDKRVECAFAGVCVSRKAGYGITELGVKALKSLEDLRSSQPYLPLTLGWSRYKTYRPYRDFVFPPRRSKVKVEIKVHKGWHNYFRSRSW